MMAISGKCMLVLFCSVAAVSCVLLQSSLREIEKERIHQFNKKYCLSILLIFFNDIKSSVFAKLFFFWQNFIKKNFF